MKLDLKDIAEIICRAEGRTDLVKVYNQLRSLGAKRLMTAPGAEEVYGPRGALIYGADSVFRARLLLVLVDLGFESDSLQEVYTSACANRTVQTEAGRFDLSLQEVIRQYADGAPNDFTLEITASRAERLGFHAQWVLNDERFGRADPLSDDSVVLGRRIEAVIHVPVHSLFAPVATALDAWVQ
jgi:hypothetical protein